LQTVSSILTEREREREKEREREREEAFLGNKKECGALPVLRRISEIEIRSA
jgi:hypothetical protein